MTLTELRRRMRAQADDRRAAVSLRFFKTGPGEYGEGDRFIGLTLPQMRRLERDATDSPMDDIVELLRSPIHEERLLALLVLVRQFRKANERTRSMIYRLYYRHRRFVNNWDLVDLSAPTIVGQHLEQRDRSVLYRLARSKNLWDRRIAMIATQHFIRQNDFKDALAVAKMLLEDREDLIHKASGWMLREIGKRDFSAEEAFVRKHVRAMPRTMLRYAVEKWPPPMRREIMAV
jgi:3-methyladenine DNA glycosylase AlkD